ncbi:MAG TPA: hypothetical protein VGL39_05510 [Jatrophihabitantaceae bacterium]|jgi:hypothetical protein
MCSAAPDSDWYLDHVVLPTEEAGFVGPIRTWQADWATRARELTDGATDRSMRDVMDRALRQGFVLRRHQVRACVVADATVRRLIRAGIWSAPRRDVVAVVTPSPAIDRAIAACAAAVCRPGHVISHRSAAVLHGLPQIELPPTPELTTVVLTALGARPLARVRGAGLHEGDVVPWFGLPVTSVARTIMDLARLDRRAGLVAADAALRERLVSESELAAAAERCAGWPGARAAREVAALASPLAESPLESLTRLCVLDAGLPAPQLQVRIVDPADGWTCRVDMLWPEQRVVLEADGRIKYTDAELWREKRRQHRLERLDHRVVRAIWADVWGGAGTDALVAQLRHCLASPPG